MPYTNADLDWRDKTSRSSVEMSNPDSRPKIANKLDNMADYDTVLIGFPIWWYVAPTIIDYICWKTMTCQVKQSFRLQLQVAAVWVRQLMF